MPTGNLPSEGKKLWERVFESAKKSSTCKDSKEAEQCAAKVDWTAVKDAGWEKDADGNWHKSSLTEFSMRIERASYDKASNERRWRAVASDTDEDSRQDSMSLQLFNDFLSRIDTEQLVPEQYQSEFWKGGMPYVSVSHYSDLNGSGVPGVIDAVYIDGTYLKAKGKFHDTALGRKCFEAICADLYNKESEQDRKVRVSIGFLDWSHQHKSNGFTFKRDGEYDFCPQCLKELLTGEDAGKIFLSGQLVHLALTRVPANKRTTMEVEKSMADEILTRKDDATSIVGEELATELEETAKKSLEQDSLVTFSEVPATTTEDNTVSSQEVDLAKTKKEDTDEVPLTDDKEDEDEDEKEKEDKKKEKSEVDFSVVLDSIQ
jgi:cation transport regulator ChaB